MASQVTPLQAQVQQPLTTLPSLVQSSVAQAIPLQTITPPQQPNIQQQQQIITPDRTCQLPSKYITNIRNMVLGNLKPIMPIAIITYGPTGSGKSRVVPSVLASDEFKDVNSGIITSLTPQNFAQILVDNFIDAIPDYVNYRPNTGDANNNSKLLQNKYFACRNEVDDLSTSLFEAAIHYKYNIVYETTGNSIDWLIADMEKLRSNGYLIILAFPLVPYQVLQSRIEQRNLIQERKIALDYAQSNYSRALTNFKWVIPFAHYSFVLNNTTPLDQNMPVIIFVDNFITTEKHRPVIRCNSFAYNIETWDEAARMFINNLCMREAQCVLHAQPHVRKPLEPLREAQSLCRLASNRSLNELRELAVRETTLRRNVIDAMPRAELCRYLTTIFAGQKPPPLPTVPVSPANVRRIAPVTRALGTVPLLPTRPVAPIQSSLMQSALSSSSPVRQQQRTTTLQQQTMPLQQTIPIPLQQEQQAASTALQQTIPTQQRQALTSQQIVVPPPLETPSNTRIARQVSAPIGSISASFGPSLSAIRSIPSFTTLSPIQGTLGASPQANTLIPSI
jgi:predicted ABC-type ATPase